MGKKDEIKAEFIKPASTERCADKDLVDVRRITWIGFWDNAFLGVSKVVGGIFGHSSALVADGIHSFADFLSDIIILVMVGVARRKPDKTHQFGHGKFETLAAVLLGVILILVSLGIFAHGIEDVVRVARGDQLPSPSPIALIILLFCIVSKEWLFHATLRVGRRVNSQAVIANAWHHRSDSLSSVATLIGVLGAIILGPSWNVLDPIAAMIVSVFIFAVGLKTIAPAIRELLGHSLPEKTQQAIIEAIKGSPGILAYSNLRTSLSGNDCIVEVHLKVDPDITVREGHRLSLAVERHIAKAVAPLHAIITTHIQPFCKKNKD